MLHIVFFLLLLHKKHSCRFRTLQLNHWSNMDYEQPFLGLRSESCLKVCQWRDRNISDFISNVFSCVLTFKDEKEVLVD